MDVNLTCASDKNSIQCLYIPIKKNNMIAMLVYDNDICFKITDVSHAVTATGAGPFMVDFIESGSYSITLEVCKGSYIWLFNYMH